VINDREKEKILKAITREECAELTKQLCDIPSPTGSEREIGEFSLEWYRREGIKAIRQEIDPNPFTPFRSAEGKGGGTFAQINGHMDTSYTGTD